MDGDLVYCNNNQELMEELQLEHTTEQWRVFTDSPKVSLKAVLLHNGNMFPSIQLAHAIHMKETYENLQVVLQKNTLRRTSVEYVYVLTWKSQQCWPSCKGDTLNSTAVYVNGTAERGNATTE